MAGSIANFTELELLDHVFKVGAYPQPTNLYVGALTGDPTDDGSGLAEPSGKGYARVLVNVWDAAASRASRNTNVITFNVATGSWGVITHWPLFDAVTGGNMLAHGELKKSRGINSGDTLYFAAGDIEISMTAGGFGDYVANALLDHLLKTAEFTQPTNIYTAACIAATRDSDTGSTITEPTGGSYARTVMNAWDVAAAGATQNTNVITFPEATASWGSIGWVALVDAETAGNVLAHGALDSAETINSTDTLQYDPGELDVTLD